MSLLNPHIILIEETNLDNSKITILPFLQENKAKLTNFAEYLNHKQQFRYIFHAIRISVMQWEYFLKIEVSFHQIPFEK